MMELWRHHRAIGNIVVGALIGLFLMLLLANVARTGEVVSTIRETQKSNTLLTKDTHSTADLIESCVNPDGECYLRGQRRTASAVADINRVVILAAACASGLPADLSIAARQTRIQTCVINRLATGKEGTP